VLMKQFVKHASPLKVGSNTTEFCIRLCVLADKDVVSTWASTWAFALEFEPLLAKSSQSPRTGGRILESTVYRESVTQDGKIKWGASNKVHQIGSPVLLPDCIFSKSDAIHALRLEERTMRWSSKSSQSRSIFRMIYSTQHSIARIHVSSKVSRLNKRIAICSDVHFRTRALCVHKAVVVGTANSPSNYPLSSSSGGPVP
jgi:hypothetical protein